jgi:hypothetical protein
MLLATFWNCFPAHFSRGISTKQNKPGRSVGCSSLANSRMDRSPFRLKRSLTFLTTSLVLTGRFLLVFFLGYPCRVFLYLFKDLPMNQRFTLRCFSIRNMSIFFFFTFSISILWNVVTIPHRKVTYFSVPK